MKRWTVTHTSDMMSFRKTDIEGTTYTDAYVNFELKYPGEIITEIIEKKEN